MVPWSSCNNTPKPITQMPCQKLDKWASESGLLPQELCGALHAASWNTSDDTWPRPLKSHPVSLSRPGHASFSLGFEPKLTANKVFLAVAGPLRMNFLLEHSGDYSWPGRCSRVWHSSQGIHLKNKVAPLWANQFTLKWYFPDSI